MAQLPKTFSKLLSLFKEEFCDLNYPFMWCLNIQGCDWSFKKSHEICFKFYRSSVLQCPFLSGRVHLTASSFFTKLSESLDFLASVRKSRSPDLVVFLNDIQTSQSLTVFEVSASQVKKWKWLGLAKTNAGLVFSWRLALTTAFTTQRSYFSSLKIKQSVAPLSQSLPADSTKIWSEKHGSFLSFDDELPAPRKESEVSLLSSQLKELEDKTQEILYLQQELNELNASLKEEKWYSAALKEEVDKITKEKVELEEKNILLEKVIFF